MCPIEEEEPDVMVLDPDVKGSVALRASHRLNRVLRIWLPGMSPQTDLSSI